MQGKRCFPVDWHLPENPLSLTTTREQHTFCTLPRASFRARYVDYYENMIYFYSQMVRR
jgi:hypothetical protein